MHLQTPSRHGGHAGPRLPGISQRSRFFNVIDHSLPGPNTRLDRWQVELADGVPADPAGICAVVQKLIIHPDNAPAESVSGHRMAEKNLRSVRGIVDALVVLNPAPLHVARVPTQRVVGTCRHFALLSCALLRLAGFPARVRCGFASYFQQGRNVDHWIVEFWNVAERRWVRLDTEIIGTSVVARPDDLAEGEFLTGGEAWCAYRDGADPQSFGVAGVASAWGVGEIRGNLIRDLASLCKVETLPWDEWGRMEASYDGRTGPEYDRLMDVIAATCAGDDPVAISRLYASEDLEAPPHMSGRPQAD